MLSAHTQIRVLSRVLALALFLTPFVLGGAQHPSRFPRRRYMNVRQMIGFTFLRVLVKAIRQLSPGDVTAVGIVDLVEQRLEFVVGDDARAHADEHILQPANVHCITVERRGGVVPQVIWHGYDDVCERMCYTQPRNALLQAHADPTTPLTCIRSHISVSYCP